MLIKPHFQFNNITEITSQMLAEWSVDTLILDVDNTLCIKKGKEVLPDVLPWLKTMRDKGIKLIILSNAMPKRMTGIAASFNLPFVGVGGKPLPFGYWRAISRIGAKRKHTAIVGDQLFTDMMGGHLAGCKTIYVSPKEKETACTLRLKRRLEKPLLRRWGIPCPFESQKERD